MMKLQKDKGFSLLEVIVAVLIAGSVMLVALPDMSSEFQRIYRKQYIEELTADLYVASNYALSRKERITVYLNSYTGIIKILPWRPHTVKVISPPPGFWLDYSFSADEFEFTPQGHITKAGTVWIVSPNKEECHITIYMAGGRFTVQQSP